MVERLADGVEHAVQAGHYFAVGEAEDAEALAFEDGGAACVVFFLRGVGVTIHFDGEHCRAASEIYDVIAEDGLEAELGGFEALGAEVVPEAGFRGVWDWCAFRGRGGGVRGLSFPLSARGERVVERSEAGRGGCFNLSGCLVHAPLPSADHVGSLPLPASGEREIQSNLSAQRHETIHNPLPPRSLEVDFQLVALDLRNQAVAELLVEHAQP